MNKRFHVGEEVYVQSRERKGPGKIIETWLCSSGWRKSEVCFFGLGRSSQTNFVHYNKDMTLWFPRHWWYHLLPCFLRPLPMPIKRRVENIDLCIADIVAALNAANIITVASCCGHNKIEQGDIRLDDGRILKVIYPETKFEMR